MEIKILPKEEWVKTAEQIARDAHKGQFDKAGEDYIKHVKRVADSMETEEDKTVAWLHDVVEDNPNWSLERLRQVGFPTFIVNSVDAITKRKGEENDPYLYRLMQDERATRVKRIGDTPDNANIERIPEEKRTAKDYDRVKYYQRNLDIMTNKESYDYITKANGEKAWKKKK